MTAYAILDVEVIDPEGYKDYLKLAPETVKLHGGKYIVRGGKIETLEGEWEAKRLVILEFPSVEHAKNWLNSSEYMPARTLRHQYARTNMIVVEGV